MTILEDKILEILDKAIQCRLESYKDAVDFIYPTHSFKMVIVEQFTKLIKKENEELKKINKNANIMIGANSEELGRIIMLLKKENEELRNNRGICPHGKKYLFQYCRECSLQKIDDEYNHVSQLQTRLAEIEKRAGVEEIAKKIFLNDKWFDEVESKVACWKLIIEAKKHSGDCTNEAHTCQMCIKEDYFRQATAISKSILKSDVKEG